MCMCDKDEKNARNVVKEPEVEESTSIQEIEWRSGGGRIADM